MPEHLNFKVVLEEEDKYLLRSTISITSNILSEA